MVVIRQMTPEELKQAHEIDVSESGSILYEYHNGGLQIIKEDWRRPRWNASEWENKIEKWTTQLHSDVMLGAFDGERLVGLASLRYRLTEDTAQLVSLHVSEDYRRQGIATLLTQEITRLVKESGARALYVSATRSESAVGFYQRQGFHPTEHVNKELYELEPEDIHMTKPLQQGTGRSHGEDNRLEHRAT